MHIRFEKLSDRRQRLEVTRCDGSVEAAELDSRSFLRHDLAHLAVELEVPFVRGFWGSVAGGASVGGVALTGADVMAAEALAGPVQTLLRTGVTPERVLALLERVAPERASAELAERIAERARRLLGQWRATPYGAALELDWPEPEARA